MYQMQKKKSSLSNNMKIKYFTCIKNIFKLLIFMCFPSPLLWVVGSHMVGDSHETRKLLYDLHSIKTF